MHIELKPWCGAYAFQLKAAADYPEIEENLRDGFPVPYTLADAEAYIDNCLRMEGDTQLCRAILADGKVVGSIGLFRCSNVYRYNAELGYWLARPYWNQGIMPEAIRRMCQIGFSAWDIVRIFAEPFGSNPASARVLEKAGFIREGTLKKGIFKRGRFTDYHIYALLRE
ncbi:MAG: GNAT family N-acetyltransferase [Bacteroides sp.]|nr:GNAT family N-acetyltransferase [Bacteroides sp.]